MIFKHFERFLDNIVNEGFAVRFLSGIIIQPPSLSLSPAHPSLGGVGVPTTDSSNDLHSRDHLMIHVLLLAHK